MILKFKVYTGNGEFREFIEPFDRAEKFDYQIFYNEETTVFVNNDKLTEFLSFRKFMPYISLKNKDYFFSLTYLNKPFDQVIKSKISDILSPSLIRKLTLPYYHLFHGKIKNINQPNRVYIEDKNMSMMEFKLPETSNIGVKLEIGKCYVMMINSTNYELVDIYFNTTDNIVIKIERNMFSHA